uniref:Uncharacterized protein n=1 Tax=Rhizophora mucronata TaxID=61149 RepID=A0A2P2JDJ5_RHIMU
MEYRQSKRNSGCVVSKP